MPWRLYDSAAKAEAKPAEGQTAILTGTVVNNCDLINQGKVIVRIPSRNLEVHARLATIGGGPQAGFQYVPRPDDQVLVGLEGGDPDAAYLLGGLWSTADAPPVGNPLEATSKRVIKTGMTKGVGHTLEFDDLKQSIKIESTTKQQVTIDPFKIELTNTAGTLSITLDNKTQTVTIKGVNVTIEAAAKLELKGRAVNLKSEPGPLQISGTSLTAITGKPVKLN
jgi:uncharacterized protein involved in type VI secretion and phage assembly